MCKAENTEVLADFFLKIIWWHLILLLESDAREIRERKRENDVQESEVHGQTTGNVVVYDRRLNPGPSGHFQCGFREKKKGFLNSSLQ